MTVSYGSKQSTLFARDLPDNATMDPGKTYHAEFTVEGIRTLIPGWESDVINNIRDSCYREGMEITYIDVDSDNHTATVQYKLANTGNATAMIAPVVIAIIYIIAIVVGIYLISLTLNGGVKELSNTMTDNPMITPIIYGSVALALIVALIYLKNKVTSSG
jgi:hypothetical protein